MSAKLRDTFLTIAVLGGLLIPGTLAAQSVDQLVADINSTLAENPADNGSYQFRILPTGKLLAERRDNAGVVSTWEAYFEDITGVSQTQRGQLYLECSEEVGDCARETCAGAYESWVGCTRGGRPEYQLSDVFVIEYGYDTRALRTLRDSFEALLAHDLNEVSSFGNRSARQ